MSAPDTRILPKLSLRARLKASVMPKRYAHDATDPHARLLSEWRDVVRQISDEPSEGPRFEALWRKRDKIEGDIATTIARTAQGAAAQLLFLIEDGDQDEHPPHRAALNSVLSYLRGDL